MKSITQDQLNKIVSKSTVEPVEGRKGYLSIVADFGDDLIKNIAVKSKDDADAREQALAIITDEPDGIRGFSIKESK